MSPSWLHASIVVWAVVANTQHSTASEQKKDQSSCKTCKDQEYHEVSDRALKLGYTVTEHTVETEDGYLLTLFRIQNNGINVIGSPVVLMHGLLQNAMSWLDAGPSAGLAYLLPAAGHDTWLGNVRGTHYSRKHAWLNPDTDPQYWKFSVDEIGRYDIPAIVDYVLAHTGADKLNYIGFSQGAGTFFIMCSERPEYCHKVQLMIALAPGARLLYTKSVLFRSVTQYYTRAEQELFKLGVSEVFGKGGLLHSFSQYFCAFSKITLSVCEAIKDALDASNPGSITPLSLRVATENFPTGTSVHNLAKYGQSVVNKKFQKFDYGVDRNLKIYGNKYPPSFNLNATTVPTVVVYGVNDGLVDIRDIKWLVGELPNVLEAVQVNHRYWTHFDMVLSKLVPRLVYPQIAEYLNKYR